MCMWGCVWGGRLSSLGEDPAFLQEAVPDSLIRHREQLRDLSPKAPSFSLASVPAARPQGPSVFCVFFASTKATNNSG